MASHCLYYSAGSDERKIQMVAASGAGLLALLVTTAMAVDKPRGMTRYGWRKQYEERIESPKGDAAVQAEDIISCDFTQRPTSERTSTSPLNCTPIKITAEL